jgi:DNA gyrase subunit A
LLADIDKDTVDFTANFDDSTVEPTVLPTKIPTLLINGSNGIAVGMATNIPPHNLTEIITAAIELVEKPHTQLERILEIVQGPDFPTGGFIHGRKGLYDAYKTGRGRFMMRAKVARSTLNKDRDAIIVTEIPYQVNKARLIERIAELVNEKTIEEISDIRDESDRDGMRIVIELKRGAQPEIVLNQLYKHTQMQESFSMIFLAVVNNQPREMGLVQALQYFIDHRVDVIRRRTAFLLQKAKDRAHILGGLSEGPGLPGSRDCHHPRQPEPRGGSREPGGVLRGTEDHDQPDGTHAGGQIRRIRSAPSRPTRFWNCNCTG